MKLPEQFNYVAAFLTFSCQLRCAYCINHHGHDLDAKRWMSGEEWIKALNSLELPEDLPITLQGGEPTAHRDFYKIVNGIRPELSLDLLTNLEVSPDEFMMKVAPERFKRTAPYSSIRVSYHKDQSAKDLLDKVKYMQDHGYHIGIWGIDHPDYREHNREVMAKATWMGVDFRLKEFLGEHEGVHYGTLRYPDAVDSHHLKPCECRTSELLIAPDGDVFRCHSDLYANRCAIGNLSVVDDIVLGQWRPCSVFGLCNSCDVKIKTNRYQEYGHSSVEIRNIT